MSVPPLDESAPEASRVREWYLCCWELDFVKHLHFMETGYGFAIEHSRRFLTPYEHQAAHAEVVNRWTHKAPASLRRFDAVLEIRRDQKRKASERRARIFAEHEWVEVPNAHPASPQGSVTQSVEPGFSVASSNEMFPESAGGNLHNEPNLTEWAIGRASR